MNTTKRLNHILRRRHEGAALSTIGVELGITGEAVRQFLVTHNKDSLTETAATARASTPDADALAARRKAVRNWHKKTPGAPFADLPEGISEEFARSVLGVSLTAMHTGGHRNNARVADEDIFEALRSYAPADGGPLTVRNYESVRGPADLSAVRITQRFNGWNRALAAAGLPFRKQGRRNDHTPDDVFLRPLRAYLLANPARPTAQGYREQVGTPSIATLSQRFGSWSKARAAALALSDDAK